MSERDLDAIRQAVQQSTDLYSSVDSRALTVYDMATSGQLKGLEMDEAYRLLGVKHPSTPRHSKHLVQSR